ncbi:MAG: bifunctional aldolase/short-chain dehydrogenase [Planctomycetes bacterium]|nr:bifunctional aldolase/short-chain dehydrogenase [Planctomycetota bacterium]
MDNRWRDDELAQLVDGYATGGDPGGPGGLRGRKVNRDVAELVYASRLLGRDERLVLHGGGNTSVKTTALDATGSEINVLCVKGSGWDLADIEPEGLPAVRLEPLCAVAEVDTLSDEAMVNAQRCNLLDSSSPTPSVETLVHATLPYKFVLHTHANSLLSLTDQADGEALCRAVYGDIVTVIPYIMPGFDLAKAVMAANCGPQHQGMILLKHGIFSFGETAREAYDRMIDLVSQAETRLGQDRKPVGAHYASPDDPPDNIASPAQVGPILRGLTALGDDKQNALPFILEFRSNQRITDYLNRHDLEQVCRVGVATPDHVIRTKRLPLLLDVPPRNSLEDFAKHARESVEAYAAEYAAYFKRNDAKLPGQRTMLDPRPRVILVRGLGLFTLGKTATEARIVADLAEATMEVITDAQALGTFESITEAETFEIEYWSLEQAKLKGATEKPFTRRVVVITGGAGTIGRAVGKAFASRGAQIVLLDVDEEQARDAARPHHGLGLRCDVTKAADVQAAFDHICATFGGVDVVVSNAGAAWEGRIGEVDDETLRASFELNFFAHQTVARHAVRIMQAQGFGGSLLFNISKQAVNPGRDFGPYGLPKAATMALVRQYALDYGEEGIRSNGINADRIRSGMLSPDMIHSRAQARQVSETDYMSGNLLRREVTAEDVAEAFVSLARAAGTTGAILTVDGGNIAAALR